MSLLRHINDITSWKIITYEYNNGRGPVQCVCTYHKYDRYFHGDLCDDANLDDDMLVSYEVDHNKQVSRKYYLNVRKFEMFLRGSHAQVKTKRIYLNYSLREFFVENNIAV